ncbi:PREDICTED: PRUPE_2G329000 [Prunus dulcis]|uniref:PREDICTED: PRUPE_2G329000 n=1 Tax=Prunus dulcis TaxID=3755 RepID=A0A5E4G1X2_PRUDU|nr:uncharacterized protein LOC117628345 isoform X1 [Prunus dulcis]XP_034216757.1 uncharacterized protein LOC117628412 isoform X1 [Prunus dulcis]VVA32408.1 PREDICTED: PRUPE_2G329000 [Prunus dulcis]VVA33608.1 PREDICTED: PRUPE_2G329000 [Prunus dulcis]
MCDKFKKSRGEARTCNVCSSTSLSSCMHIKPVASLSQAATETDGFSDEVSMGKAAPTSQDFESNSKALVFLSNKANSSEISSLTDIDPNRGFLKFPSKWPEEQAETLSNSMATFRVEDQIGGKKEDDVKCDAVVEEQEAPSQSQPVNCDDGSDVGEDDVKVCDICGDTGREELLATCSRCIDGAEHIYCMQVMMEKVPGDDWMCEDCMHMEESEKQNHNYVKAERVVKGSSLSGIRKNYKNVDASEFKNRLSMKSKCARVEIKTGKAGSTPSIAGKGPTVNAEAVSVSKRRALETSVKLPRVPSFCSKTVLHKDASKKELDKKKIKATTDVISGDRSSSSYLKNAYLPITSDKSDKFRLQMQLRKGALLKSKSFNIIDSKVKGKLSDEGGVQKHKFVDNNATDDNKKKNIAGTMCKSLSFDNARSNCSNCSDTKVKVPYHLKDSKKSTFTNQENSTQVKHEAKLLNPLVNSSGLLVPQSDKKIAPSGQTSLLPVGHDLETGHRKSKNLSEASNHLAHEGSRYVNEKENRVVGDAKQHADHYIEAAVAIRENNSNVNLHSEGRPHVRNASNAFSLAFAVPQLDYIWKGGFEMWRNGRVLGSCDGMQAHLSTVASPKVLEVVPKLPQKMLVEEVPRLSTWPTQFVRNHPTEDNIALYFFAEDLESYRRNYKVLVECMVRDDLALRANVDGVELLIFPSNMLPEDSQCWNRMLFLWGVFRGRRVSCSELMQPSRDVNQVDSILKGGQSKQRQEMDFRFFLQGSKRYSIDSVSVDEEPDLKRVKTDESKYSDKGFPFQTDVCGSGFSGDHLGCGKPYDMSVSSTEMQVRTTIGKDQTESQVPGIELSLGAPFIDFEHQKEDRTSNPKLVNNINDEDNEVSTSLSLSLALPSPLGNKY